MLEWQGYSTMGNLVSQRLREAAITNPGPLRVQSLRIPASAEARLVALSELLRIPRAQLLRDIVMTGLLEAEDSLRDKLSEESMQAYQDQVEQAYITILAEHGADPEGVTASVVEVHAADEGEAS